jgi:hypothetical protein
LPIRPTHEQAKRLIAFGAGLLLLGLILWISGRFGGWLLGCAALFCSAGFLWRGTSRLLHDQYVYQKALGATFPQPSDLEVDRWFDEALARLSAHSLEKLELTPEECEDVDLPPIIGPVLWNKGGIAPEDVVWKSGQDGLARFGVCQVSHLWFAEEHLGIFRCDYDLIRDAVLNEETQEFFYRDIIAVSTLEKASSLTLPSGYSLTSFQEFRISVANDRYFAMTVGSSQLRQLTGAERLPENGTEQAIRALRAKLKARKGTLLAG